MANAPIATPARSKLFADCSRRQLQRVDSLATEVVVAPGKRLCEEGAIGLEFFVLLSGVVSVSLADTVVSRLHAGDWFGEIALISPDCRRTATVVTNVHSRVLVFNRREYRALSDTSPSIERALVASAQSRTRSSRDWRSTIHSAAAIKADTLTHVGVPQL